MKKIIHSIQRFIKNVQRPSKKTNLRRLHEKGEDISKFIFRDATTGDIPALAALHVQTWAETYGGNSNPHILQVRESQWREQFAKKDETWFCIVIENEQKQLIGFAKGMVYTSDKSGHTGDLNKIYLLRRYHRLGLGRKLLTDVAQRFLKMNIHSMVLFGIPQNPSCYFHEAMGGERMIAANGEFHGGYKWKDLDLLVKNHGQQ